MKQKTSLISYIFIYIDFVQQGDTMNFLSTCNTDKCVRMQFQTDYINTKYKNVAPNFNTCTIMLSISYVIWFHNRNVLYLVSQKSFEYYFRLAAMQTWRGAWKLVLEHIIDIRVSVHHHLIAHVHLVHPEEVKPRVASRLTAAGLTSDVGAGVSAAPYLLTGCQANQDRAHDHHDQHTAQGGEHFADDGYSLTRNFHVEAEVPCPWIFRFF